MKSKVTAVLIGLILPTMANSQTFSQYFDGADTSVSNSLFVHIDTSTSNVWQIGPPQKTIFNNPATLPNAMVTDTINDYPTNNTSSFSFGVDPQFYSWGGVLALQWKQKLDMDKDYDGGIIEFSVDTGKSWQNAFNNPYVYQFYGFNNINRDTLIGGDYAFSGTDSTWKDVWLCFDVSWISFSDSLMFRFTLKSDSVDNNREGWIIDNLLAHITILHTINEIEQEEYMKVKPNPTTGKIKIVSKKLDEFHIIENMKLTNIEGKIVQEWGVSPTKFSVDISNHPDGIYFLSIQTNIKSETFKIILER